MQEDIQLAGGSPSADSGQAGSRQHEKIACGEQLAASSIKELIVTGCRKVIR